ncbi:MAG TPA: glutathione S-transferase family protein [Steroidobacteraceae bacterium]|nr:glutathione S-transferase family protein [Steroidobacteraceae bacterium]
MYTLHIANKNYSSWSLRPWVLMRELHVPFTENLIPFHRSNEWAAYRRIAPNGKVPCLVDGDITVWDSLSIVEYLAERHAGVWPEATDARAWSRSAAAEMHSGFGELRSRCAMSCGIRVRLHAVSDRLSADLKRLATLWNDGLEHFGGPFLAGSVFSGADAFYAPVVFRIQTYGLKVDRVSQAYVARMLEVPAMRSWYTDGLRESWRDLPHEAEITQQGEVVEDLRVPAVSD